MNISELIRSRHSSRVPFDPTLRISEGDLAQILEAARWAPTAHNMQNFEIVVVDDSAVLSQLAAIETTPSEAFLRENYEQLSFSEADLLKRKTGILASGFPAAWLNRNVMASPASLRHTLGDAMQDSTTLLIVVYDPGKRAPASDGDFLGIMSLGCVMQNLWLSAHALGVSMQILSTFSAPDVVPHVRQILRIPEHLNIAFACRMGYAYVSDNTLRVRRDMHDFVHRGSYGVGFKPMNEALPVQRRLATARARTL